MDVLAKPHYYDDSHSRRELTWSPSVGSFEQEMPRMATYIAAMADRPGAAVTSPPEREGRVPPEGTPVDAAPFRDSKSDDE